MLNSKKVFYNIKLWAKNIFCSQITWWFVVIFIMAINPGEKLKSYIPSDWYLWFMLIFTAFLVWVIFKASHNCKKTSIEDIVYMGTIYSLGLFVCLSSPISNSYPEKDIQKLFDCLTSLGPLIVGFAAAFFACMQWKVAKEQNLQNLRLKRLELAQKLDIEATLFDGDINSAIRLQQFIAQNQSNFKYLLNEKDIKVVEDLFNFLMKIRTSNILDRTEMFDNLKKCNELVNKVDEALCSASYDFSI